MDALAGLWLTEPVAEAFIEQVNAVGLYFGVNYSLVILAYYVPVASVLQTREGELTTGEEGERDSVYGPMFMKILTLAAPALVGAAAPAIDLFTGS